MQIDDYSKIIYTSDIPALELDMEFPYLEIYKELKTLKSSMVEQLGNKEWKGSALRGISDDKPRPYYEYGYKRERDVPYKWTSASEKCPITKRFILRNFDENLLYRIKFNLLKPQGRIHLHSDGISNALGISDKTTDKDVIMLSLAVYWPQEVIFNLEKIRVPFKSGKVFLLNFSKYHEVFNPTTEDRYYLVISGRLSESYDFRKLVIESYKKNKNKKYEKAFDFNKLGVN